jgi:hypothetical protein
MSWKEISEIYLPEIRMTFGKAVNSLKKSWFAYKMARKQGLFCSDIAYRIRTIENAMGVPVLYEFPELEGLSDEQSREEIELRREEEEEGDGEWTESDYNLTGR